MQLYYQGKLSMEDYMQATATSGVPFFFFSISLLILRQAFI
ncbi:hypothetical protein [Serratia sp. CY34543]